MPADEPCTEIDDADADVILKSASGDEIPAHMYQLQAASIVFRDMFSMPRPPNALNPLVVPFTESTAKIRALKLAMYLPRREAIQAIHKEGLVPRFEDCRALYEMGVKYQLDKLLETFSGLVELSISPTCPIDSFAWACQNGSYRVAYNSIRFFPTRRVWPPGMPTPYPWFMSADQIAAAGVEGYGCLLLAIKEAHHQGACNWEGVAKAFSFKLVPRERRAQRKA